MEMAVVGKRVWRMEVAFMRAILVRVFIFAILRVVIATAEAVVYDEYRAECFQVMYKVEVVARRGDVGRQLWRSRTVPHFVTSSPKQDQNSLQQVWICMFID
jgi:hypothetical protein